MSHNERGLRIDGAPVKRSIVTLDLPVETTGPRTNAEVRALVEDVVHDCMGERELAWTGVRLLGRPNAKRATVAPDAEA